ncbi:integrase [Clostridium estertheticum]|uniref:integrase n=1 Tax=Clostridium estertheticum TaxID=238834 RepID=UPI001CF54253|nr:integrase [Clostridium estertheticum]MCB2358681.1 integrase [Clostridium estertheticum]
MKGWNMFSEIKKYKTLGFNKSQVGRAININYKTVQKYWDMTPDRYAKVTIESKIRHKKLMSTKMIF